MFTMFIIFDDSNVDIQNWAENLEIKIRQLFAINRMRTTFLAEFDSNTTYKI